MSPFVIETSRLFTSCAGTWTINQLLKDVIFHGIEGSSHSGTCRTFWNDRKSS